MKASLSESHRKLVEMMQNLNFGRIEGLQIRNGEPVLDPPPRLIRDIKLGGENGPRPELGHFDFALKSQVLELLEHFTELENCRIEVLEVKNGLPFRLVVEQLVWCCRFSLAAKTPGKDWPQSGGLVGDAWDGDLTVSELPFPAPTFRFASLLGQGGKMNRISTKGEAQNALIQDHARFVAVYPLLRRAAQVKASSVSRRCGLPREDDRDLEQEAVLEVWRKMDRYDPGRASFRTFAEVVMASRMKSLMRSLRSERSGNGKEEALNVLSGVEAEPNHVLDVLADINTVLNRVSNLDRRVALSLVDYSAVETSLRLNVARSTVYRAIERLRCAFIAAGFTPSGASRIRFRATLFRRNDRTRTNALDARCGREWINGCPMFCASENRPWSHESTLDELH
jgi:RNA polymerase sigma factor (sigma-70 family)